MADAQKRIDFVVSLNGAKLTEQQIKDLEAEFINLHDQGVITKKTLDSVTQSLRGTGQAAKGGKEKVQKYAEGFDELAKALSVANKELREQAQLAAAAGSTTPIKDVAARLPIGEAKEYIATQEAMGATAVQVARETVRSAEAATKAEKAAYDKRLNTVRQYVSNRVAYAKQEAEAVQRQRSQEAGQYLNTLRSQIAFRVNYAKQEAEAQERQATATRNASQATNNMATGSLPRLRYALYDVSTTLAIAGAAMTALGVATVGTSIKMDRQFADVIRTVGTYTDDTGRRSAALRREFNELFSSIPASWGALSEIGTLAGQLGIAERNVANFTNLVAKFATVTDVSVEQSATAFGRLSQLLKVPASEYENLGSSILAVGVDSVATESQIINTSAQIAAMGNFAGFSADEVFGLSAALASLGTQPELSRGVITRLFTKISVAISDGGERLENFGRVAGMTGSQFATAWGENASDALYEFLDGLGQIEASKSVSVLNDLGITAARDVPTILRLAQNSDLLARSLAVAAQGYAEGSILQEQYGVIADTVAEKLTLLRNNFQLFVDSVGASNGVLGSVVDMLSELLKIATGIIDNPVSAWFLGVGVAIVTLAGVTAVLVGGVTRGAASMLAMATAARELGVSSAGTAFSMRALWQEMTIVQGVTASTAVGVKALKGALISTGFGAVAVLVGTLAGAFIELADSSRSAEDAARSFFGGDYSGFSEAIQADTEAWKENKKAWEENEKSVRTYEPEVRKVTDASKDATEATSTWVGVQEVAGDVADGTTQAIKRQTIAFGENADAWIRNALVQNESIQKIANDPVARQGLEEIGLNWNDFIVAGLEGGSQGIEEYMDTLMKNSANVSMENRQAFLDAWSNLSDAGDAIGFVVDQELLLAETQDYLGGSTKQMEGDFQNAEETISDLTDGLFDLINGELAVIGSTYDLGAALQENGLVFDQFSVGGRANIEALKSAIEGAADAAGGDANQFSAFVAQIVNDLVAMGAVGVQQLDFVRAALGAGDPGVVENTQAAAILAGQLAAGYQDTARAAQSTARSTRSAQKEIRTLSDYVSDLGGLFRDAFDFRFGFGQAKDTVLGNLASIRESFEDARQSVYDLRLEIQGYRSDILGLKANETILTTQLSVAREYGDTVREQKILAELSQITTDLAEKESELAKAKKEVAAAQQEATPSLTGNTKAAQDQRAAVLDLLQSYQDQIVAYANTGASQSEVEEYSRRLRREFESQLTQLGYNRAEIKKYSASFQDMTRIIQRLPRNITVKVDASTDPASRALREFLAKERKSAASSPITIPVRTKVDKTAAASLGRLLEYTALAKQYEAAYNKSASPYALENWKFYAGKIADGDYWGGGYTGPGGTYEPAGTVHRGEYVIPKRDVNQSTGLPYADALARLTRGLPGRSSYAGGGFVQPKYPTTMMVELSPLDRQLLAAAGNTQVSIDGQVIASATNRSNARTNRIGAGL